MKLPRVLSCAALLLCVSLAQALPTADAISGAFEQMDPDRDQRIGLVEWDQHAFALFRAVDANRDHSLDAAEIQNGPGHSEAFAKFDLNQSGRLEIDEFMLLRRKLMAVADINGSDTVDRVEFELFSLITEAGWEDTDHNGRIGFPELRASLAQVFQLADADHDGILGAAEASFLRPISYAALTEQGPLTSERLYLHYRNQLTGL